MKTKSLSVLGEAFAHFNIHYLHVRMLQVDEYGREALQKDVLAFRYTPSDVQFSSRISSQTMPPHFKARLTLALARLTWCVVSRLQVFVDDARKTLQWIRCFD